MNYATTNILANRINATHWQFPRELVNHIISLVWDYPLVSTHCTTTMLTLANEVYLIKIDNYGSQILRTSDCVKAAAPPGRVFAQALCYARAYIAVAPHSAHAECVVYMSAINDLNKWVFVYSHPKIISLCTATRGIAVIVQAATADAACTQYKQTGASPVCTECTQERRLDVARPMYELWVGDGIVSPLYKRMSGNDIYFAGTSGDAMAVCDGNCFEIADGYMFALVAAAASLQFVPKSVHFMNRAVVIRDTDGNYRHRVTGKIIPDISEYTAEDVFPANCLFKTAGPTGFVYATRTGLYQILAPFAGSIQMGTHHKVISWESLGGM